MLQQFLIPKLEEDDQKWRIHFQEDGAPPPLNILEKFASTLTPVSQVYGLIERRR
jgi:hypothetical protein